MKTKSEMMKRLYDDRKKQGLKPVKIWLTPHEKTRVEKYLRLIRAA